MLRNAILLVSVMTAQIFSTNKFPKMLCRVAIYVALQSALIRRSRMQKYIRSECFTKQKIGSNILLLPIGKMADKIQGAVVLDEISLYIWDLLASEKTMDDIIEYMLQCFDVQREIVEVDMQELLEQFVQCGIIILNE